MVDFTRTRTPPEVVLEQITRTIVAELHPRRIILIGSRARGDARPNSDYDVVVEFDTDRHTAIELSNRIYGLFPGRKWSINVIPRWPGEIERSADDPGTIDWDIVREGKVLYSVDGQSEVLPRRTTDRVRKERAQPPASVQEWMSLAERDLEQARFVVRHGGDWAYVCFHAQQSAEKYLKTLLVRHFIRPDRTHNLEELLEDLTAIGVPLSKLEADCKLLTPYAVAPRYGVAHEYDEATGRAALAAAERIAAAVGSLVNA